MMFLLEVTVNTPLVASVVQIGIMSSGSLLISSLSSHWLLGFFWLAIVIALFVFTELNRKVLNAKINFWCSVFPSREINLRLIQ